MVAPTLVASMRTTGRPSWWEGRTTMSAAVSRARASRRWPRKRNRSPRPRDRCRSASISAWSPCPAATKRTGSVAQSRPVGRLQQHVVPLLRPKVGHGDGQEVSAGHPQSRPAPGAAPRARRATMAPGRAEDRYRARPSGPEAEGRGEGLLGGTGHRQQGAVPSDRGPVEQLDQWGDLVPQAVLGVDRHRSPVAREGQHHQATQGGGVGKMEVHDGVAALDQEPAERRPAIGGRGSGRRRGRGRVSRAARSSPARASEPDRTKATS